MAAREFDYAGGTELSSRKGAADKGELALKEIGHDIERHF